MKPQSETPMRQNCLKLIVCVLLSLTGAPAMLKAAVYPSSYDIVYHRIKITVDPGSSAAISNGSVTTYFKTTANSVNQIGFDLNGSMTISSVTYHGAGLAASKYPQASNAVIITLPAAIATKGTLDSITISYSGTPILPGSPVPSGYNSSTTNKAIYTLGESFTGNTWWPCHDSLTDKIDSVDLIITTPLAYRAAGNGLVTETTTATTRTCTWKTRYRIATYMINFAAAAYTDYSYTISTNGKTLLVQNYLYNADFTATYKTATDFIKTILPVYTSIFNSDYPFVNEKYGIADCYGGWGALEVQSMTFCATSSITSNSTLAHELAHQWFADKLTTNDWHQIWLNEGFAQFCESVIYPENLLSASTAQARQTSLKSSVGTTSSTYVNNISSAQTIFAGSDQPYEKGAMVLSMLREWLGPTKFYTALHDYLEAPGIAYDFTSVDSLKKYMQQQTPNDLTQFFNDWVMQKGTVKYNVKYQYVTNGVYLQLSGQTPSSSGAGYFDTPVPIQIKNSSGLDTTIVVIDRGGILYNNVTGATYNLNTIYYKLSATPTVAPIVDPKDRVLADALSTTASSSLSALLLLPIQDINLAVTGGDHAAKINWKITANEPIDFVELEKSRDGISFESIARTPAVSIEPDQYTGSYDDGQVNDKTTYYRLKVSKLHGGFMYSVVKLLNMTQGPLLTVSPNPAQNYVTLTIPSAYASQSQQIDIKIYNSLGLLVQDKKVTGNTTATTLSCKAFAGGIYKAILTNEKQQQLQTQFIKQ